MLGTIYADEVRFLSFNTAPHPSRRHQGITKRHILAHQGSQYTLTEHDISNRMAHEAPRRTQRHPAVRHSALDAGSVLSLKRGEPDTAAMLCGTTRLLAP
ncbi:hypothetical protein FS749_003527 [Ceratobasidium sp. UAMH 11750]|nr:hypothetical protein FS749_003527 [Ceratobasidium sp. UAMH 11750]